MSRIFTYFLLLFFPAVNSFGSQLSDSVQIGFPGQFSGTFEFLNALPAGGLDLDGNGTADVGNPCSCRPLPAIPNGALSTAGVFDSWLVIATGISGQQWRLQYVDRALHPVTLAPIPFGTQVPEVGASGVYVLHFAHRDAAQYIFVLENTADFPGQSFGPVINTCYYPDPQIAYLDDFYCSNSPDVLLYGFATSAFDGNLVPIDVQDEYWTITRQQNGQTFSTPLFSPETFGQGTYTARYIFDAGDNAFYASNKTGCSVTVEAQTIVRQAGVISCNDAINITLNPAICEATVEPALLLSFTPISYQGFSVEVLDPSGNSLGVTIPADYANIPLLGVLTDDCSGIFCTTQIIARDLHAPALNIPPDITIPCTSAIDPSVTGAAGATDCSPFQITYQDQTASFPCGNPSARITRTWRATDAFGNTTTANQIISIARGNAMQLRFPADVEYECDQYAADPSITDPLPGKAGIPTLVDIPLCGLIFTSSDDTIPFCGNPNASFIILRTWTVLDACGFQPFTVDGAGNDNIQIIRVRDETPPQVSASTVTMITTLSPLDNGLQGCSAVGFIPPPEASDACNAFQIRIFTPAGELEYANGLDGSGGGFVPFPGLQIGAHTITYQVVDACGNSAETTGIVEVTDSLPPVMLCNSSLNVTLTASGEARITPQLIDAGSRDDCCIGDRLLKIASEPDSAFSPFIDFSCPETLQHTIVLRVSDCYGNFNECSANLNLIDPVSPSVVSVPPNATVTCLDDLTPFSNPGFNAPVFTDNCPFDIDFSIQTNINNCGAGVLQRTWTAGGSATAGQTVFVNAVHHYSFRLPDDLSTECGTSMPPGNVQILLQTCDQLTVTLTVDTVSAGPANCRTLQRTYDIVNLCEAQPGAIPVALPRQGGLLTGKGYDVLVQNGTVYQVADDGSLVAIGASSGVYRYVQRQDIIDNEPPAFSTGAPEVFCAESACLGPVILEFEIADNCASDIFITRQLILNNQTPSLDGFGALTQPSPGHYRIQGDYPVGIHTVELTISDGCGNAVTELLPFEVRDCGSPTLTCIQEMVVQLDSSGTLELRPELFAIQFDDNCPGTWLSFDPFVLDTLRIMTCDSLGFRTVNLWLTDAAGNQAACQSNFELVSQPGICPEFWPIRGIVRTENQLPVAQVTLHLEGALQAQEITPANGRYEFLDIPGQAAYTLRPEKLIHSANGVSTFDLVLISRHILGVEPFNSPYKIIAADVNRSGTVSTLDLILLRRVILGVDSSFSNNTSWRFIPADYEFPIPANPFFGTGFPEIALIPNLQKDTVINFIGIKVGDVNASADPQQ